MAKSEFLKAAIMESHNCAKYLRICANFGLMNANEEKLAQLLYIYHNLTMFSNFTSFYVNFTHVFVQNFQSEHFDCANKLAFRKSGGGRVGHMQKLADRWGG